MVRRIMRKVMRGNPYRIFDYVRGYAQCYARLGNIMREGVFTARGNMRKLCAATPIALLIMREVMREIMHDSEVMRGRAGPTVDQMS